MGRTGVDLPEHQVQIVISGPWGLSTLSRLWGLKAQQSGENLKSNGQESRN